MKKSAPLLLLPDLLRDRLIPWTSEHAWRRMIVAKPKMSAAELPDGVQMERRKLQGKRHIVTGDRYYSNMRVITAEWPDDNMMEIGVPKLVCVTDGRPDFQVGEYLLSCDAGNFILIPPNIPQPGGGFHYLEGSFDEESCELLQIIFYRGGIQCILCRSLGSHHEHIKGENYFLRNEQIRRQFDQMMIEAVSREENHRLLCGNSLANLLLLMQREVNAGRYLLTGARLTNDMISAPNGDFSTELKRLITARLGEPLTLESVARQMHLSRSHFALRIRQETGKTFVEYLTELRLEEARILLRDSDWTSAAISKAVGFKHVSYFHLIFREKTGIPPGKFRKKCRQDSQVQELGEDLSQKLNLHKR